MCLQNGMVIGSHRMGTYCFAEPKHGGIRFLRDLNLSDLFGKTYFTLQMPSAL